MIGLVDGNNFFVSCERVFNRRLVGRPVAVLSNNDGCCVARSNEFKALGIPMGTPYFQLKAREATGELSFCSSNYELYGDMSRRIISILREEAVDVEQYSIDEAFIYPPTTAAEDYPAYGRRLRAKILFPIPRSPFPVPRSPFPVPHILLMAEGSEARYSAGWAFPAAWGSRPRRRSPRSQTTSERNARKACFSCPTILRRFLPPCPWTRSGA